MGIYTSLDDPEADRAVQMALDRVVDGVVDLMGDYIDAIVLTGGFGRGEGGVIQENGRYRPVNDFDISIIVSRHYVRVRKRFTKPLSALAERLASETGVKQIDLGISHPLRFRFAPNLVESYEIRNGHRVLWGNIDLRRLIPPLPAGHLSLLDGAIYFLNRGSGLLIPALYFLPEGKVHERHRENFQIELDKACMAMGDAFLLFRRRYHYSYVERNRRLETIDLRDVPEGETLRLLYVNAVERKLRPRFDWLGDEAMVDRWFHIRDLFGRFFLWLEAIRLGYSFKDWGMYSNYVERHTKDCLRDRLRLLVRGVVRSGFTSLFSSQDRIERFRQSRRFLLATMPMLLFSLKCDGVEVGMLRRGRMLLGLSADGPALRVWEESARSYLGIIHPGGVVRELVGGEPA